MKALTAAKKYWLLILIGALMIVLVLGFLGGYRLGSGGLTRAGTLVVEGVPDGSTVFVDQSRRHVVSGGATSMLLTPGTHSVIVDAGANYPWNELVTIEEDQETHVHPLLVAVTSVHNPVITADKQKAQNTLWAQTLPTKSKPLTLAGGCASVYVSGNRIIGEAVQAEGCSVPDFLTCTAESKKEFGTCLPTVLFEAGDALQSVFAYPMRDDAMIIASGNTVYVLEVDPREPRFFAPLVKGASIRAIPWSDTSIITSSNTGPQEIKL